ncbi:E3 ubiquitin-protein ligase RNF170-like [Olea europaea var. sylvestris]|uniref:E3 ubiquitin-protein ligase RNF170 n=1 Tax=Olea europaea subsp. europaea TaxID=158383 RepID=A0A8S0PG26_OLEEU|nr:E3 ubiquitin-protein ligase RNF170-like [Olea europaea var. sylvestris]CAA2944438.1 E3 ubiquitin-protein ligase RNF170 [Olea europaea subsp. europaea]
MDGPTDYDFCSICQANFHIPCQANCSHWFCGNCILQVWNYGSALHPCKCPLCRREITLLVPSEVSSRQRHDPGVAEVLQRTERYNHIFGERSNGLMQRMQDLPFLLRRLLQDLINPQRSLPLVMRARVFLAIILSATYVLSPVDIVPEALLGIIGLLDDFIIVLICFLHVAALYRSVLVLRHGGS